MSWTHRDSQGPMSCHLVFGHLIVSGMVSGREEIA